MKWLICFLLFCVAGFGWDLQDFEAEGYSFQWDREEDFQKASEVFFESFKAAYRDVSPEQLGSENIEAFLQEVVQEELELQQKASDTVHWLIVKKDDDVVGLFILELNQYPLVYGRQMAIKPEYTRKGIGKLIANVVIQNLPHAERFAIITRVFNQPSICFFKSLGFKQSEYMHEGYDPNKYVGYEYSPTH